MRIRAAAVVALRGIDEPKADQLITAVLLGDPAGEVRRQAVFAASFRRFATMLPGLTTALRQDQDPTVRMDVLRLLANRRNESPECTVLIAWSETQDSDESVRQVARELLRQG